MIRRPPRSTQSRSSAASDVYKRQIDVSALKRIREKTSQTVYDREGRRENMKNSFAAKKVPYPEILLVDDIITTGATMESCALAILENNPGIRIGFASLAYVE